MSQSNLAVKNEKPQGKAATSPQGKLETGYRKSNTLKSSLQSGKHSWECLSCGTSWNGDKCWCKRCGTEGRILVDNTPFDVLVSELYGGVE